MKSDTLPTLPKNLIQFDSAYIMSASISSTVLAIIYIRPISALTDYVWIRAFFYVSTTEYLYNVEYIPRLRVFHHKLTVLSVLKGMRSRLWFLSLNSTISSASGGVPLKLSASNMPWVSFHSLPL